MSATLHQLAVDLSSVGVYQMDKWSTVKPKDRQRGGEGCGEVQDACQQTAYDAAGAAVG